jgi:hypothetical protein
MPPDDPLDVVNKLMSNWYALPAVRVDVKPVMLVRAVLLVREKSALT